MALPRGLAPRTSAFAGRHARFCYTSGANIPGKESHLRCELRRLAFFLLNYGDEKVVRHAGAAPAPGSPALQPPLFPSASSAVWKTAVLAVTPMTQIWWLLPESRLPLLLFREALISLS